MPNGVCPKSKNRNRASQQHCREPAKVAVAAVKVRLENGKALRLFFTDQNCPFIPLRHCDQWTITEFIDGAKMAPRMEMVK